MFKSLALAVTISLLATTVTFVPTHAFAEDEDVFIDEGDGDFDVMPIPPPEQAAQEKPAPKKEAKKAVVQAPAETDEELADEAAQVAREEVPPPPQKAKKVAAKKAAPAGGKGLFVRTTDSCPMFRSPASEGEQMFVVKASKKIWVERAGDGWYNGWDKNGNEGYISADCAK